MDKVISTRHIRHDWQTFVDWEQKSVRTCCGVTTKRHLAGIPGVTEQPQIVEVSGRKLWGWCMNCVVQAMKDIKAYEDYAGHPQVNYLYIRARQEIHNQWLALVNRRPL